MNDFMTSILGNYSIGQTLAFFVFFLMGLVLYQFQEVKQRDKWSINTPHDFYLKFLILDNLKRFAVAFILIYVQFRFYHELTGQELTEFTSLLIGYMGNGLADFGKRNLGVLREKREKL